MGRLYYIGAVTKKRIRFYEPQYEPMASDSFTNPLAEHIWRTKYRFVDAGQVHDHGIADTWRRVAHALAQPEPESSRWEQRFAALLQDFRFLPGGRIQAGAGTAKDVTLFNCFVMGILEDSMDSIFDNLKEGAITMQQGGGVGYDFSTLRPRGSIARRTGRVASGPVSFMHIWDAMCNTVLSTGARRGAMLASLRCDHPDIEDFIEAKRHQGALRHFNLSVQVTDDFMRAVDQDASWPLVFPDHVLRAEGSDEDQSVERTWTGTQQPVPCQVFRRVRARELWNKIMRSTYDYAEPGVLFVDTINRSNNLWYREQLTTTNPCGEIPLPPYGACDLGSINLTRFVDDPFSDTASLDLARIAETAAHGVRLLDNVIDISRFPDARQAEQARGARRIGLGITGLADALIMLNIHYDSEHARSLAAQVMQTVCHSAYRASIDLAREKGPFAFFDRERYLQSTFIRSLPSHIIDGIARHGIRNSHLLAIAPTGTISLLANNVSSGIEPVFDFNYSRRVLDRDGEYREFEIRDYAYELWLRHKGDKEALPGSFVTAHRLEPQAHLAMQAALQPCVDNSISKTINVAYDYPFEKFVDIYQRAHAQGLKGCTTFRSNAITGEILSTLDEEGVRSSHCCSIEREAD